MFCDFSEIQENVKMTLEGAQASFITHDRLVLSLKNGELYVLTLQADSMRSIRSFNFEKAAASVLTTCVSMHCGSRQPNYTCVNLNWFLSVIQNYFGLILNRKQRKLISTSSNVKYSYIMESLNSLLTSK